MGRKLGWDFVVVVFYVLGYQRGQMNLLFFFVSLLFYSFFFFWSGGGWREKQRKGKGLKMDAFDKPAL